MKRITAAGIVVATCRLRRRTTASWTLPYRAPDVGLVSSPKHPVGMRAYGCNLDELAYLRISLPCQLDYVVIAVSCICQARPSHRAR